MDTWPVNPARVFFSVKAFTGEDLLDLHKQQSFTNACKNNGIAHVNKPSAIHLYIIAHTNSHAYTQAEILIK